MTYTIASYNLDRVLADGNFARLIGDSVVRSLHRDWLWRWSITFQVPRAFP